MNDVKRYDLRTCPDCEGKGEVFAILPNPDGSDTRDWVGCSRCKSQGYIPADPEPEAQAAARLIVQDIIERDAYQERLERELTAARAEISRLRAGLEAVADELSVASNAFAKADNEYMTELTQDAEMRTRALLDSEDRTS